MANTYTSFHYHFTFSTKNREPWIVQKIEARIWAYIGGIARKHKMTAIQVGGIEDHIHALVLAPPTIAPSQVAQYLKGDSSKWIHDTFKERRSFEWQEGYAAFSIGISGVEDTTKYIHGQVEHHRKMTFREEIEVFLKKHDMEYVERDLE